jgi:hypothetical protein
LPETPTCANPISLRQDNGFAASYQLPSLESLTEGKAFRAPQAVPALVQRTSLGIALVPEPLFFLLPLAISANRSTLFLKTKQTVECAGGQ